VRWLGIIESWTLAASRTVTMATYVLIHGADSAFYWHLLDGEMRERGHEVVASRGRDQAETLGLEPWPLDAWPDVPTRYLLCRDDRLFPAGWMRAERLEAFRAELQTSRESVKG
jgi:hypothetical protein